MLRTDPAGYVYHSVCSCDTLSRRRELWNAAGVPAHFAEAELEEYREHRLNAGLVQQVWSYAKSWEEGQANGILLYGDPGVGKTHLMVSLLKLLIFGLGVRCMFRDFFLLLSELREGYAQKRPEAEMLRPLAEVDVLLIDELGKGRGGDWELGILDEIICRRYNLGKPTLITTNFGMEGARPGSNLSLSRPSLEERVGDRVFSRLKEMCVMFHVAGPDYRRLKLVK